MPYVSQTARYCLFALALLLLTAASSVVVVGENEQAVITKLGEPVRVVNRFRSDGKSGAGAVFKLPFIEQVLRYDRAWAGYSLPDQALRSGDDIALHLGVDITYRIIDPVRLAGSLGAGDKIGLQVRTVLPALLSEKLGQRSAAVIAMPEAGGASREVLSALDAKMRSYGVQVVDLRIGRVSLTDSGLQLAYQGMQDRYEDQASAISSASAEASKKLVAETNAETTAMLQASAGRDPEFFAFFRALRSYDRLYGDPKRKNAATIVIPPGSAYLRSFNGE